jgi:hypothetical protein
MGDLSKQLGISQEQIIQLRRQNPQFSGQVTGDEGKVGQLEQASFAERSGLASDNTATGTIAESYWDASRGVTVHAPYGKSFELLPGGGVRVVATPATGPQGAPASSLFTQPTQAGPTGEPGAPVPGLQQENLGITPAEGKTIARTGQTIKNPQTGVDVYAKPGNILIQYTDGTYEERPASQIQTGTDVRNIDQSGPTPDALGITRQTEIKGGAGSEITRAPMSAAQALAQAKTPEEADAIITGEGQISTKDLQLVGPTYRGKTAKEGNLFYVDPKTKEILERPASLQSLAQPLTTAGVAGTKIDVVDKFRAVFGRDPNADELKYWMGRTDKIGSALVSTMQFAKQQGKPTGIDGGDSGSAVDPVDAINAAANLSQGKLAAAYSEAGINVGSSEKAALKAELEALNPPKAQSLETFTKDQLASSQFQEAQNNLNQAKDALRKLDQGNILNQQDAEHGGRAMGLTTAQVRRNQSEFDLAYQRSRAEVVIEVQAYSDIVQSQLAITGMMIDAFKYDQQTAQVEYTNKLNKATSMYDMVTTEQRDAFNVQQKLQDNQRANLSVVTSLLQSGNLKYDNLTPDQKAQLTYMEQQVGLPAGFTKFIGVATKDPVVTIGSNIVGADGTVKTPVYTVNPTTGALSTTWVTQPLKERVPGTGTAKKGTTTATTKSQSVNAKVADQLRSVAGSDGYLSPQDYKTGQSAWVSSGRSAASFNTNFKSFINPADPQDYK